MPELLPWRWTPALGEVLLATWRRSSTLAPAVTDHDRTLHELEEITDAFFMEQWNGAALLIFEVLVRRAQPSLMRTPKMLGTSHGPGRDTSGVFTGMDDGVDPSGRQRTRESEKKARCTQLAPMEPPPARHLLEVQTTGMQTRTRIQPPLVAKVAAARRRGEMSPLEQAESVGRGSVSCHIVRRFAPPTKR